MAAIQHRTKWIKPARDFKIDDVVLLCDDATHRSMWPLGRVVDVTLVRDKHVRLVTIKTKNSVLKRPVNKLCLLEGAQ